MSVVDATHRRVGIDTAPLIYFLEGGSPRAAAVRSVLAAANAGDFELTVSAVTEAELFVGPLRRGDPATADPIHALLNGSINLRVVPISRPIARLAAELRARFALRLADALVAATALDSGCTALLSNDRAFARLADRIEYIHLDDQLES